MQTMTIIQVSVIFQPQGSLIGIIATD